MLTHQFIRIMAVVIENIFVNQLFLNVFYGKT